MSGLDRAFNEWWDSDELVENNPFSTDTAMFWAWEGWQAGVKREREACAKVCEPKTPRPCDCERCECGNATDARIVAQWDESASIAAVIRARGQSE